MFRLPETVEWEKLRGCFIPGQTKELLMYFFTAEARHTSLLPTLQVLAFLCLARYFMRQSGDGQPLHISCGDRRTLSLAASALQRLVHLQDSFAEKRRRNDDELNDAAAATAFVGSTM